MSVDYLDIGPVPAEEECAQVGASDYDYMTRARKECNAYVEALRKKLGPEPDGAMLRVKSNPHDFGSYLSVRCYYETDKQEAVDYALKCEGDGPNTWAEVGMSAPFTYSKA